MKLFSIEIDNCTILEALNKVKSIRKGYVVTPNVDHIVKLQKNKDFRKAYDNAALVLADGMPIIWASKLLGNPLKERVAGSDLFLKLLAIAEKNKISVFFLGSVEDVSKKGVDIIKKKYPKLKIAGRYSPPFGFEKDDKQAKYITNLINKSKPNILFILLGAPKQEIWIHKNINNLRINVALCVGASLDFVAGKVKRAPKWMQKSGLEWLWRMIEDPKRLIKRYLIDDMFPFAYLTIKEFFRK